MSSQPYYSKTAAANPASAYAMHALADPDDRQLGHVSDNLERSQLYYDRADAHSKIYDRESYFIRYVQRPLPELPLRKYNMVDLERPSTSEGRFSHRQQQHNNLNTNKWDKRVSRDDFYLNTTNSRITSGFRFYGAPSVDHLSYREARLEREAYFSSGLDPEVGSPPFDDDGIGPIGMALGSPTQEVVVAKPWDHDYPHQSIMPEPLRIQKQFTKPPSEYSVNSSLDSWEMPAPKKSGRWRLLGLFGRKGSMERQQEPTMRISGPDDLAMPDRSASPFSMSGKSISGKSISGKSLSGRKKSLRVKRSESAVAKQQGPKKPVPERSATMPYPRSPTSELFSPRGTPQPVKYGSSLMVGSTASMRTSDVGSIPIALETGLQRNPGVVVPGTKMLLDVEIPSVKMDRYSVMFGSVLQRPSQNSSQASLKTPSQTSSQSLLARRQATLTRLRDTKGSAAPEEDNTRPGNIRRATSPQPVSHSPGLGLFPQSQTRKPSQPHKAMSRAHTTPPTLLSSHPKTVSELDEDQVTVYVPGAGGSNGKPQIAVLTGLREPVHEPTPKSQKALFSQEDSEFILSSPTDIDDAEESKMSRAMEERHAAKDNKWKKASPSRTASSATSSTTSGHKRSTSSTSSTKTHMTKPSADMDGLTMADPANMNPVEISIARQISVSREQRKMLQPLKLSGPTVGSRKPRTVHPSLHYVASGGITSHKPSPILVDTSKALTPTIVSPQDNTELEMIQKRKSSWVVLDGVDT